MANCEIVLGSEYLGCCNSDVLDFYGVYLHNLLSVFKGFSWMRCAFLLGEEVEQPMEALAE